MHPEIQIWVYDAEKWPERTLDYIYDFMMADPPSPLFWRDGIPHSHNLFIRWTTEPGRILFFPIYCPDLTTITIENIIGMCWLDEIEPHRAAVHFWVRKKYWWRRRPLIAARKFLQLIFREMPTLQLLTCRVNSENRLAVKFMRQVGVHIVGEIPGWYNHGGTPYAATFGYLSRASTEASCRLLLGTTPLTSVLLQASVA